MTDWTKDEEEQSEPEIPDTWRRFARPDEAPGEGGTAASADAGAPGDPSMEGPPDTPRASESAPVSLPDTPRASESAPPSFPPAAHVPETPATPPPASAVSGPPGWDYGLGSTTPAAGRAIPRAGHATPPAAPPSPSAPRTASTGGGNRRGVGFLFLAVFALLLAAGAGAVGGAAVVLVTRGGAAPQIAGGEPPVTTSTVASLVSAQPPASTSVEDPFVDVVRATRPSVVTVLNLRNVRVNRTTIEPRPAASGSGVIFDERGYIATNNHVVQDNQGLQVVFLDGRIVDATVVGSDPNLDVAILKVNADLPAVAPLADSSVLEPGMRVLAIGSPLGTDYQNTVTTGIVAGLNRTVTVPETRFDPRSFQFLQQDVSLNAAPLIQTDAAINAGNSGGPLLNLQGEVVGLNTLVVRNDGQTPVEGFGFAVPSNVVHALADEWIDGRARPVLGIGYQAITPDVARDQGLTQAGGTMVVNVDPNTGAADAGLQSGDILEALDGVPLNVDHALTDLLWRYRAGDTVTLTARRGAKEFQVKVVLSAHASETGQ